MAEGRGQGPDWRHYTSEQHTTARLLICRLRTQTACRETASSITQHTALQRLLLAWVCGRVRAPQVSSAAPPHSRWAQARACS